MEIEIWRVILCGVGAYLLGSIPSAVWIGKIFYGVDVREHGSHNAGTTNVMRVLGKKAAIPVFIIDVLKGYIAVRLAAFTGFAEGTDSFLYAKMGLCLLAVLGHIKPIFAGFKGGKGVATLVGAAGFGMSVGGILLTLLTFFIIVAWTKYVSVGSMVGGLLMPFFTALCGQAEPPLMIFLGLVSALIFYTHLPNIGRLLHGTENKTYLFGRRKEPQQQ